VSVCAVSFPLPEVRNVRVTEDLHCQAPSHVQLLGERAITQQPSCCYPSSVGYRIPQPTSFPVTIFASEFPFGTRLAGDFSAPNRVRKASNTP